MARKKPTVEQAAGGRGGAGEGPDGRRSMPQAGGDGQTFYRWRSEYGGLKLDQAKPLKELERENARLKRAVAELTLDKLILKEAAEGHFQVPSAADVASTRSAPSSACPSGGMPVPTENSI